MKVKLKKEDCIASLPMYEWMFFSQLIWKQPSSQESFKLFRTSSSCKGALEHVHAPDYSILSWMSLLEKLINPSLIILFTLLHVVQHSQRNINQGAKQYDTAPQQGRKS